MEASVVQLKFWKLACSSRWTPVFDLKCFRNRRAIFRGRRFSKSVQFEKTDGRI